MQLLKCDINDFISHLFFLSFSVSCSILTSTSVLFGIK